MSGPFGRFSRIEEDHKCDGGCEIHGCPGHKMVIAVHNVSNTARLIMDGKDIVTFDIQTFNALKEILRRMDSNED